MNDFIVIGSMTIRTQWLIFLFALLVAFLVLYIRLGYDHQLRKSVIDICFDFVFYFLFFWMASPVLFHFSMIVREPLLLLYYPSGYREYVVALLVSMVIVMWKARKAGLPPSIWVVSFLHVYVTGSFVYYLVMESWGRPVEAMWFQQFGLDQHPLHLYHLLLFLPVLSFLLLKSVTAINAKSGGMILLWMGSIQWLINLFFASSTFLGAASVLFGALMLAGLVLIVKYRQQPLLQMRG